MTSLAHLLGMIYDLRSDVERHQILQQCIPLNSIQESSYLSEIDDSAEAEITKARAPGAVEGNTRARVDEVIEKSIQHLSTSLSNSTFEISLDVSSFNSNEIMVKVKNDEEIIINVQHGEQEDEFGFFSRHLTRKYNLPPNCDTKKITSQLTDDGKLTIKVEMKTKAAAIADNVNDVKFIQISQITS
jgi:hypothetical protein